MNREELLEALKKQKEKLLKIYSVSDEEKDVPSNIQKMYDMISAMTERIWALEGEVADEAEKEAEAEARRVEDETEKAAIMATVKDRAKEAEEKKVNMFSKMYDSINTLTNRIIEDHAENEPFDFNSYRYAEEIKLVTEANGAEFPKVMAPIKLVKENADKTISFTGDYSPENVYDNIRKVRAFSMISPSNPIFRGSLSLSDISKMTGQLRTEWTRDANATREGAMPFIYFTLLADGYSPEQIVNCEVPEQKFKDIYNKVMDIANPEKKEETLQWCTEKYVQGISVAYTEYEKRISYSERVKPETMFGLANNLLNSMIHIGGTNYLEDPKFRPRYESVRDKLKIPFHGEIFDIDRAHSANFVKLSTYTPENVSGAFDVGVFATEKDEDPSLFVDKQIKLFFTMRTEQSSFPSYNRMVLVGLDNMEGGEPIKDWLKKHDGEPGMVSFLADNLRTGKFFSNFSINQETGSFEIHEDVKELEKDYSEYVLNNSEKIRSNRVKGAARVDRGLAKMTPEELSSAVDMDKERKQLTTELDSMAVDRIALINQKAKELKKDIQENGAKRTTQAKKLLGKMIQNLNENTKEGKNKYNILSNFKDSDLDFSKEGKEERDSRGFDALLDNIIRSSERENVPKKESYTQTLSQKEINRKVDSFVSIETSQVYKKSKAMPTAENTVNLIKEKYEKAMNDLAALGKLDQAGQPTGNSDLFNDMYNSMNDILKYNSKNPSNPGEGLNDLLEKANKKISDYIENRDSFIKWTHKGRERLKICKDFIITGKMLQTEYSDLSEELLKEHHTHQRAFAEKTEEVAKLVNTEKKESGKTKVIDKNKGEISMEKE